MRTLRASGILLLLVVFVACASTGARTATGADQGFITNQYKLLRAAGETYDKAMLTLGAMYKAGQLSEKDKVSATAIGKVFKSRYDSAVDALALYSRVPTEANRSAVTRSVTEVGVQVSAITALTLIK